MVSAHFYVLRAGFTLIPMIDITIVGDVGRAASEIALMRSSLQCMSLFQYYRWFCGQLTLYSVFRRLQLLYGYGIAGTRSVHHSDCERANVPSVGRTAIGPTLLTAPTHHGLNPHRFFYACLDIALVNFDRRQSS